MNCISQGSLQELDIQGSSSLLRLLSYLKNAAILQIDPGNRILMEQHLACAASESPLILAEDERFFGPEIHKAADTLLLEGTTLCTISRQLCSKDNLYLYACPVWLLLQSQQC